METRFEWIYYNLSTGCLVYCALPLRRPFHLVGQRNNVTRIGRRYSLLSLAKLRSPQESRGKVAHTLADSRHTTQKQTPIHLHRLANWWSSITEQNPFCCRLAYCKNAKDVFFVGSFGFFVLSFLSGHSISPFFSCKSTISAEATAAAPFIRHTHSWWCHFCVFDRCGSMQQRKSTFHSARVLASYWHSLPTTNFTIMFTSKSYVILSNKSVIFHRLALVLFSTWKMYVSLKQENQMTDGWLSLTETPCWRCVLCAITQPPNVSHEWTVSKQMVFSWKNSPRSSSGEFLFRKLDENVTIFDLKKVSRRNVLFVSKSSSFVVHLKNSFSFAQEFRRASASNANDQ